MRATDHSFNGYRRFVFVVAHLVAYPLEPHLCYQTLCLGDFNLTSHIFNVLFSHVLIYRIANAVNLAHTDHLVAHAAGKHNVGLYRVSIQKEAKSGFLHSCEISIDVPGICFAKEMLYVPVCVTSVASQSDCSIRLYNVAFVGWTGSHGMFDGIVGQQDKVGADEEVVAKVDHNVKQHIVPVFVSGAVRGYRRHACFLDIVGVY